MADAELTLLADALDRVREVVQDVLTDVTQEQLDTRPAPGANPVGWLVWHLTRVQDDHLAKAAGARQTWDDGWRERFGLDLDDQDGIGYGHTGAQVDAVRAPAELLADYHDAVNAASTRWLRALSPGELSRVVDDSYDPPVTLAVRLVSVVQDDLMHAGQAAYAAGIVSRVSASG